MSRTKPDTRDAAVMTATVAPCRLRLCVGGTRDSAVSGEVDMPGARRHITALHFFPVRKESHALANIASARKRARQSEKRRGLNASQRSMVRTYIKKIQSAIADGKKAEAGAALKAAIPRIDGMVNKGILSKNKAARHKSRLNAQIKALPG
jgi:small subunit ribosomal protein S20